MAPLGALALAPALAATQQPGRVATGRGRMTSQRVYPSLQRRRYRNYSSTRFSGLDPEPTLTYRWDPEREAFVFIKGGTVFTEDPNQPPLEEMTSPAAYRWAFEDLEAVLDQIPRSTEPGVQP